MTFVRLRASENITGNSQLAMTMFVGRDPQVMQSAGEVRLTYSEYEEIAVGFLMAAALSVKLKVTIDGWGAHRLVYSFLEWRYEMNIRDALNVGLGQNQGCLAVINSTGDTRVVWDRTKPLEVEIARAAFDKAKASGYMAYKIHDKEGKKGEVVARFDPLAERLILAPPLAGGVD